MSVVAQAMKGEMDKPKAMRISAPQWSKVGAIRRGALLCVTATDYSYAMPCATIVVNLSAHEMRAQILQEALPSTQNAKRIKVGLVKNGASADVYVRTMEDVASKADIVIMSAYGYEPLAEAVRVDEPPSDMTILEL